MDDLRLQAVAARVVAWHNRHPLARRINAQQVRSVGYVAFTTGAEVQAAAAGALAPPVLLAPTAAEPAAAEPAVVPAAIDDMAFEIELGVTDGFAAVDAAAEADTTDAATLLAPEPTEAAAMAAAVVPRAAVVQPMDVPTLPDRVLQSAQQPAVQGALLTTHEGYRPTLHPHPHPNPHPQTAGPVAAQMDGFGDGDHRMTPLSPRGLARWVMRHGCTGLAPPVDGPVRCVSTAEVAAGSTADPTAEPATGTTYVMTATITDGRLASRVLVGAGQPGAVLGTRLLSLPRTVATLTLGAVLLVAATVTVTVTVAVAGWLRPAAHAAVTASSVARAKSLFEAATAAAAAAAAASAAAAATASAAAAAPPAANAALAPTPITVKPPPAYAQSGPVGLPSKAPGLSEEDKAAARVAVAAARAARPAVLRAADTAAPAPQTAPATGPAAAQAESNFAISTRALRTRAEAEQLQAAITALLRTAGTAGTAGAPGAPGAATRRVELLPLGDDWRVVAWPFNGQADADRMRALLAGRGMRVEVVRF